ncbi:MAG: hypothetical protein WCP06_00870 [Verrucomicrobiota bacterium]
MKRIEYTAAAIRLLGLYLLFVTLAESMSLGTSFATNVIASSFRAPTLHILGFNSGLDAGLAFVLSFLLRLSVGVWLVLWAKRFAGWFWTGISFVPMSRGFSHGEITNRHNDPYETETDDSNSW